MTEIFELLRRLFGAAETVVFEVLRRLSEAVWEGRLGTAIFELFGALFWSCLEWSFPSYWDPFFGAAGTVIFGAIRTPF